MHNTRLLSKIGIIFLMSLILLFPASLIQKLVEERAETSENASTEIAGKWGSTQIIKAPIMIFDNIDFIETYESSSGSSSVEKSTIQRVNNNIHLAPKSLNVNIVSSPLIKKRGIFETVVYNSEIKIEGQFDLSNLEKGPNQLIDTTKASLSLNIKDLKGLISLSTFEINGMDQKAIINNNQIAGNISSIVSFENDQNKIYNFLIVLKIRGHKKLEFEPSGLHNNIKMQSDWKTVSYIGSLLPNSHTNKDEKSIAIWDFPGENLGIKKCLVVDKNVDFKRSTSFTVGANFITPVDHYQKVIRSTKYAILFIVLTFSIFFFIEILNKKRIHPIQYLLVSAALLLFYTLLLSLSEQIGFALAYLISTAAIISLISFYTKSILQSTKLTIVLSFSLLMLYSFLYFVLQLENFALLAGSIGLFILLSILMIASRKFDWYGDIE